MEEYKITDDENERIASLSSWSKPMEIFDTLNEIYKKDIEDETCPASVSD